MKHLLVLRRRLRATKGGAIVEFAFLFPILLSLIGGVADFGLYLWQRGRLANAVTYGTHYAFLVGTATGANTNIKSAVTSVAAASLTGTTVSVTGPACYCVSGTNPPTMTASTCGVNCSGTSVKPGYFVNIQASYTYTPIFSVLAQYLNTTMYESVTMRVQ